jgi:hypothetical protein
MSNLSPEDREFLREAREHARQEMYKDLAGTYDRNPLSPRGQAIQDARDAGVDERDFIAEDPSEEK